MELQHMKITFAVAWIAALVGTGFLTSATPLTWFSLLLVALVPPMVVARRWRAPDQTLSQSIQEARR